jgi:hypothetical protein
MIRLRILGGVVALFCLGWSARPASAEPKDYGDVTKPTPVTVHLQNAAPRQVFDEIAKQAGQAFLTQPANLWEKSPGSPISLELKDQPFWVAMKEACGKAGISLKYATDTAEPRVILARDNQDWTTYPTVSSGPFLVSLIGLHRASTVDLRKPKDVQRTFYAKFTVFCEPRFRFLRAPLTAKIEEAVDDKGTSLVPKKADASPMNFVTSWVYNLEGRLDYPKEAGARIAKLRASATFIAQTKSETIEVADPLTSPNASRSVAGRKVVIKEVRRGAEEYEATVALVRDGLPAEQWENTTFPGNALRLVDAEGKQVVARGFGLGGRSDESTFVFKFEKEPPRGSRIGKPVKLVWEIPTETREVPVVMEFKDLPMP